MSTKVTRRDALKVIPAAAVGLMVGSDTHIRANYKTQEFYPHWAERLGSRYALVADDVDISEDCFYYDMKTGEYQCYSRDAEGEFFIAEGTDYVAYEPKRKAKRLELVPHGRV